MSTTISALADWNHPAGISQPSTWRSVISSAKWFSELPACS